MAAETKKKKFKIPVQVLASILWVAVGIILVIYPGQSLDTICKIAGILILIVGIAQLVIGLIGAASMPGQLSITTGIIAAAIGLFIAIRPDILVSVLPFVAGALIIIHGISAFYSTFSLIGAKYSYWWVGVLLSVLSIVFGCILFFNAHAAAAFMARMIGIFLIYVGISHLWISSRKAKMAKMKAQEDGAIDVDAKITDV